MTRVSHLRIPLVAKRGRLAERLPEHPWADAVPVPVPRSAQMTATAGTLLDIQHAARRARAEARSLSPLYLDRIEAQLRAERAVEEHLERGRVRTRAEVRRATDPDRGKSDGRFHRFPADRSTGVLGLLGMVAAAFGAICAPFLVFFALVLLFL